MNLFHIYIFIIFPFIVIFEDYIYINSIKPLSQIIKTNSNNNLSIVLLRI